MRSSFIKNFQSPLSHLRSRIGVSSYFALLCPLKKVSAPTFPPDRKVALRNSRRYRHPLRFFLSLGGGLHTCNAISMDDLGINLPLKLGLYFFQSRKNFRSATVSYRPMRTV